MKNIHASYSALLQINATLREVRCFSPTWTTYTCCDPGRVAEIFLQVRHARHHAVGIQVNLGKTKVWNGAAVKPKDLHIFGAEAWKGEGPEEERGLVVLGVPVGHSAFVQKWLVDKEGSHLQLLARIPAVQDTQCAWLPDVCWAQGGPHPNSAST